MKKLVLCLVSAVGMCLTSMAAELPFLGWECTDVAAMKEHLNKPDVNRWHKLDYAYAVAAIENPASVDTFAKMEAVLREASKNLDLKFGESEFFDALIQIPWCRVDSKYTNGIVNDPRSSGSNYFKIYYLVVGPERVGMKMSDIEKKSAMVEAVRILIASGDPDLSASIVGKYIDFSAADEDDAVLKNLKYFYRLALPKLSVSDKWKPMVVQLTLAMKSRGVEVK